MSFALELSHIKKNIGKKKVLYDVSLAIDQGSTFALIGPNGSGKTTLMKIILGFIQPDEGSRKILHQDINPEIFRKVGFMPENTYFYKFLTGKEFLEFHGHLLGLERHLLASRIIELLRLVDLSDAKDTRLSAYSKGMLERIGFAQAILHDPEIIFLDEPMSGLDPIGRRLMKDIFHELHKSGKTIFFNTHFLTDVEECSTHFALLSRGRVLELMPRASLTKPIEQYFLEKIHMSEKMPEGATERFYNE